MATFEYVDIPPDAVRLKPTSFEPATKTVTTLPDTSRATSPTCPEQHAPALSLIPQMLLSTSLPASQTANIISSVITTPNTRAHTLLSTRDPLSVPIMTANFRRFVSRIGPVFWLQDRIEEIVLWKKGWKRTVAWISLYGFLCYFPKMTLLIPHIVLLGIMLHRYPDPTPIQAGESTADWQANIQAIQNLMGAFSDAHDAIVPHLPLLVAPQPPPPTPKSHSRNMSTTTPSPTLPTGSSPNATRPTHHPLLISTLLSFLLLLPILATNLVPLRLLFFLAGAGGVGALHPSLHGSLSAAATALSGSGPGISFQLSFCIPRLRKRQISFTLAPRDVYIFFRRLVDDDRLDDAVWRAPLSQVELWENERWTQDTSESKRRKSAVTFVREGEEQDDDAASTISTASASTVTATVDGGKAPRGTWSKANLKASERVGWTRGRDGWSGVGGEVSSNLTFSLSSGWVFVNTESWRPDLKATWAVEGTPARQSVCVGADEDGWTYTTDTWTHPRPDPRPCDGWVTRRRRWVRRVYFNSTES